LRPLDPTLTIGGGFTFAQPQNSSFDGFLVPRSRFTPIMNDSSPDEFSFFSSPPETRNVFDTVEEPELQNRWSHTFGRINRSLPALLDLGFTKKQAERALVTTFGDLTTARSLLIKSFDQFNL
jgi:hypothetical protein